MNVVFVTNNSYWNVAKTQKCPNHDPSGCQKWKKKHLRNFQCWTIMTNVFRCVHIKEDMEFGVCKLVSIYNGRLSLSKETKKKRIIWGDCSIDHFDVDAIFYLQSQSMFFFLTKKSMHREKLKKNVDVKKAEQKEKKIWGLTIQVV